MVRAATALESRDSRRSADEALRAKTDEFRAAAEAGRDAR